MSRTEELIRLSKVMAPYKGMYVSHIRGEGNNLLPAAREVIRIGEEAGVPAFISHIKVMGSTNEGTSVQLLKEMDEAIGRGLDLWADQYPYTAGSTQLMHVLPPEYKAGGTAEVLRALRDSAARAAMPDSHPMPPYSGARNLLPCTILDDREAFQNMVRAMYDELPVPKPRKRKEKP